MRPCLGLVLFWAMWMGLPGFLAAQEEIDSELQELLGTPTPAPERAVPGMVRSSTVTGISNVFNPAIGIAGLILGAGSDAGPANFGIQEVELSLSSFIDPFFRVDLFFAVEEEFDVAGLAHEEEAQGGAREEPAVVIEQAMITTTSLPSLTLRFGKYLLPFGKHNILHRDQFPFISAPVVIQETFGGEGLNEKAIDAALLLPLPFFSELNLVAFQGGNEPLFRFAGVQASPDKAKYLAHSKNLFDFTDDSTIELGLSYLSGTNNAGSGALTTVSGVDLTFKQRPLLGRGLGGLTLQAEYIAATREAGQYLESSGHYVSAQWRVFDYWWVQGRYGQITIDELEEQAPEKEESRHTDFLVAWVLSEFSVLRLQYSLFEIGEEKVNAWFLQYNFVTGAHPPHLY